METSVARDMLRLIRAERHARLERLRKKDSDAAYDQWLFFDEPCINELCLVLLVAIRHQVERELVWLAARAGDGRKLEGKEYLLTRFIREGADFGPGVLRS